MKTWVWLSLVWLKFSWVINNITLIVRKKRKSRALARDFLFLAIPWAVIVIYLKCILHETKIRAFNLHLASFVCVSVWRARYYHDSWSSNESEKLNQVPKLAQPTLPTLSVVHGGGQAVFMVWRNWNRTGNWALSVKEGEAPISRNLKPCHEWMTVRWRKGMPEK